MSSKSTVLYTEDEHWFTDGNVEVHDGVTYSDVLTIHIEKKNVLRFDEDADSYVLDINPNSDLYKQLVAKLYPLTEADPTSKGLQKDLWAVNREHKKKEP